MKTKVLQFVMMLSSILILTSCGRHPEDWYYNEEDVIAFVEENDLTLIDYTRDGGFDGNLGNSGFQGSDHYQLDADPKGICFILVEGTTEDEVLWAYGSEKNTKRLDWNPFILNGEVETFFVDEGFTVTSLRVELQWDYSLDKVVYELRVDETLIYVDVNGVLDIYVYDDESHSLVILTVSELHDMLDPDHSADDVMTFVEENDLTLIDFALDGSHDGFQGSDRYQLDADPKGICFILVEGTTEDEVLWAYGSEKNTKQLDWDPVILNGEVENYFIGEGFNIDSPRVEFEWQGFFDRIVYRLMVNETLVYVDVNGVLDIYVYDDESRSWVILTVSELRDMLDSK
jgi:hypothetical protein